MDLPEITADGHFDRAQKPLIFSSLKLSLQLKSLLLCYCIKTILQQ